AAAALSGSPSIRTFAIGVFTPDASSAAAGSVANLATAGGTGQPYVIATDGADGGRSVEADFENALQAIRGVSLPCRFTVSVPDSGAPDLDMVSVTFTPGAPAASAAVTVPSVASAAACGASDGDGGTDGWYWSSDTGGGLGAGAILDVCPATCATLRADPGGHLDVVIGCQAPVR
ncbi:MAG: hypothetical protein FWD17_12220, partial [Polyangiaceae bacterium]|nr:hypothetical protein [Polyangiaceae bacterium]